MAVDIKSITFDRADPYRLAQFWSQQTGFSEDPDNGNAPEDPESLLVSPDGGEALLFIAVPEPKPGRNRVHLDLVPLDRRREEEGRPTHWPRRSGGQRPAPIRWQRMSGAG